MRKNGNEDKVNSVQARDELNIFENVPIPKEWCERYIDNKLPYLQEDGVKMIEQKYLK